jgi:hypothetical protein
MAADIGTGRMSARELWIDIISSAIDFDQIILEFDSWVHISFNPAGNRRKFTIATIGEDKQAQYENISQSRFNNEFMLIA